MSQHLVLTFLSDIKTEPAPNADGMEEAKETLYTNVSGEKTRTTNESALRYLLQELKGEPISRIFVLASKAVRGEAKRFISAEMGGKQVTHLEYFRERMRKFIPDIDHCMPEEAVYPYDESETVEEALRSVAKMAQWIQEFKQGREDVILHVDLTGGMRSTNMMMLDVVRLLEYSGVRIEHLLYSKLDHGTGMGTVEELGNVYELFQLISGAEEFVNFGSAKALKDFYQKQTLPPQLQRLLNAMDRFAEEIKLCHYGQLEKAIVELHDAIEGFHAETGDDVQSLLMGRLMARIRKEYRELIAERKLDDLRVIRWCLEHGYMQQALTLYTERIPEYMGEHGLICQTAEESERLERLVSEDTMNRNRWFYLLNECLPRTDRVDKHLKKYCSLIKDNAIQSIRKKRFDMETWWEEMAAFLADHSLACKDEQRLKSQLALLNDLHSNPHLLRELSNPVLDPIRAVISRLGQEMAELEPESKRLKRLEQFLLIEMKNEDLCKWMPIPCFNDDLVRQYPHGARAHEMILDGIFAPSIEESTFLSIMDKYVRLKDERNHSNHARHDQGEFSSAQDLKDCMVEGLNELEQAVSGILPASAPDHAR